MDAMKNQDVFKECHRLKIKDGMIREMAFRGSKSSLLKSINLAIERSRDECKALEDFYEIVNNRMEDDSPNYELGVDYNESGERDKTTHHYYNSDDKKIQ